MINTLRQEVLQVIVNAIKEVSGIAIELNQDAELIFLFDNGLGFTSIDFISLLVNIEDELNIVFSDGTLVPRQDFSLGELLNDICLKIEQDPSINSQYRN